MSTIDSPHPPSPTTAPVRVEERLGTLRADRPCVQCGFNLYGATIMREPHYRLVTVRCPECGTMVALQEYPSLSRWTHRLRSLAAALWVAAVLAGIFFTSLITWGMVEMTASSVCSSYHALIQREFSRFQATLTPAPGQTVTYATNQQVQSWWEGLPPERFLAEQGGLWALDGALNWWGLIVWVTVAPVMLVIGICWSIVFARARAWRLLMLMLVPLVLAAFYYYEDVRSSSSRGYNYWDLNTIADAQVGWLPAVVTLVFSGILLWVGCLVGRRVARWLIATVLPPQLAASFGFLWHVDGLAMPRAKPLRATGAAVPPGA